MKKERRVIVSREIFGDISAVYTWFFRSENYIKSPIVFLSKWRNGSGETGSERDIIMIAGWYFEEITETDKNNYIRYKVKRSFPGVKQDFTEISFLEMESGRTLVTWTIDICVPLPVFSGFATKIGAKTARILYGTIINSAKKALEVK